MAEIRLGVGEGNWPAGVGANPGGAMAGVGRRSRFERFRAVEREPIALGRRVA